MNGTGYEPTGHAFMPSDDGDNVCRCGAWRNDAEHGNAIGNPMATTPCDRYQATPNQRCAACGWHRIDHAMSAGGIGCPPIG